ncbi:MAG: leucine-rich repeat protein [Alistipes sp.]|nr:leucine-rich repeat protein [Alistipes sp.]
MKRVLTIFAILIPFVSAIAQTQSHSIIIDEQSLTPVQTDVMSGVAIDKITLDTSRRPCARLKMHINRMSRTEIDGLLVQPVGGSVVVMKQMVATDGNGLIIELTAKQPTRFYLHHDKYGDSNEVSLNLEGNKEYRLSAELNITYPIFINTNVVDAEIYIDGSFKGRTDSNYTLTVKDIQPGKHTLKIQHGTDIAEQDIEVTSDNLAFRIEVNTTTSRAQYVVFQVVPSNAVVSINKKNYTPDSNGVVTTTLQNGTYNYEVRADEYHSESGTFTVRGEKIIKPVELKPAYGWLTVADNSVVNGANIYVDNKHIGKAPITRSKIAGGTHHIMVVKDMYHTLEESITIRDNEELKYTPTLSADFATVTFDAGTGCDIYINDARKGTSPWTGNLATGTYIIEARKEGHRSTTISQNITATPSKQKYTLNAPMPIIGTINIVSTPALAKVYIDDQPVGETPLLHDVLVGNHEIEVKAKGYRSNKQSVTIAEGEAINVTFTLEEGSDITFTLEEGSDIPNNVIEYVSNSPIQISSARSAYLFGADIKSHTWNDKTGKGKIVFESDVTTIGKEAFYSCGSLTSVTIPDSVTSIGNYAFANCYRLTSVTIPDSVTLIGDYAFSGCSSLTSVTIGDSVTTIGGWAFKYCNSLTSVTIGDSVTTIGESAFYWCNLTSVTISDSVTTIGENAFDYCCSLTSVYISDIAAWCNISFGSLDSNPLYYADNLYLNNELVTDLIIPDSVTTIGDYALAWCKSLTSVTIPDSVTTIGRSAFNGCDSLTSVTIPDSVTKIGDFAFCHCSSLTSVTIGDSVTSIEYATFRYCENLTSVTIGDSVTTIGEKAFYGCSRLASVYCKATTPPSLGVDVFKKSAFSRKIYVPMQSVKQYKRAKGWKRINGYNF